MSAGYLSSAQACPTTQSAILLAIVAKLRTDMPDIFGTDTTCFVSDVPWPSLEVQDDLFCTVCPMNSRFDADYPVGAANQGIVEIGVFQVTVSISALRCLIELGQPLLPLNVEHLEGGELHRTETTNHIGR